MNICDCSRSDRASLLQVKDTICSQRLDVGGLIISAGSQGNEDDETVLDFSPEAFQDALVTRSARLQLSEILVDPDLEFFVALEQLDLLTDRMPLSLVSAASSYRSALIRYRRARGLTGSIVHHIPMAGLNSGSHEAPAYLTSREIHEMIAQAILVGQPTSLDDPEITACPALTSDQISPSICARMPKMWHQLPYKAQSNPSPSRQQERLPLKKSLEQATQPQEAVEVVVQALIENVCEQLHLSRDASPEDDTLLSDLGWDSMMAVQLRSWMGKNLQVDIPIIRMMGGSSIRAIATEAAAKLKTNQIPNLRFSEG